MKLLNSFSLNMLADLTVDLRVREIPLTEARACAADLVSAVGHADTAAVYSEQLGVAIATARVTVSLAKGETVLVGQYRGPRLPEGATHLPTGATIQWLLVTVVA